MRRGLLRRMLPVLGGGAREISIVCPAITPTAGAEMWDAAAAAFTSGTYAWAAGGSNTIENDANTLKITRVDNNTGAIVSLRDSADLSADLAVGTWYQVQASVKVNTDSTVIFLVDANPTYPYKTVTSTTFAPALVAFRATSATANTLAIAAMGAGEIAWVDDLSLKPLTFSSLIAYAGDHAKNGTYICTPTKANPNGAIGLIIEYKDELNFVMAVLYNAGAFLFSCINGVYARKTSADVTYIPESQLKVVVNGTSHSLYYRGVQVGTTQTIDNSGMGTGVYGFNTIVGDTVGTITTTGG